MIRKLVETKVFVLFVVCTIIAVGIGVETASAQIVPVIYVHPEINARALQGQSFTLDVNIANVTLENSGYGVYGWEFDMSFNSSLIEIVSVMEGPWLKSGGETLFQGSIDNEAGTVVVTDFLIDYPGTGVVGSGTLANVTFLVVIEGQCPLHFYKTLVRTYDGSSIQIVDHTAVDGLFTIQGDVNGDGYVNIFDLLKVRDAIGSQEGDPNWNPNADLNGDGFINIFDLLIIRDNIGKGV